MVDKRYYTPSDRDYLIRTMIGEAGNQPDDGLAAVGHVVLNRVNKGYGRTPTEVVFAKNQFEPWSTRRDELLSYSPDAPEYKRAAAIADGVISGKIADPTKGATHFLQEDIVRQRRGGALPNWARGQGLKIGDHTFHYPDEPDRPESKPRYASAVDKYSKGNAATASDAAPAVPASVLDKYTRKAADDPGLPPGHARVGDFTVPLPDGVPAPPAAAPPSSFFGKAIERFAGGVTKDAPKVGNALWNAPGEFLASTTRNAIQGFDQLRQGLGEAFSGDALPSEFKPQTSNITSLTGNTSPVTTYVPQKPGGVLRSAGGALAIPTAPLTAATEALEGSVEQLTGNPEAGKRAGFVANALGPAAVLQRGANRLRPTTAAREEIGGAPLSAEESARLATNPRLAPMDVNPTLQGQALRLSAIGGENKNLLYSRVKERADTAPDAVREAYTASAGPAIDPVAQLRSIQETAQTNASKGFKEAFKDVQFVNPGPVIMKIDSELKPGVTAVTSPGTNVAWGPFERRIAKLRNELTDGTSVVTDPQRLHEIQYTLGREIRNLSKSASGADKNLAGELKAVHNQLVKQIDEATSGKYQPARKQFKDDMDIADAYKDGFDFFRNRGGFKGATEDSPSAWREAIFGRNGKGGMTKEEVAALKLGARASVEQAIMGFRHSARRGTDIVDVPYNMQKMELLFGKQEAARLGRLLRDEKDMAYTNNRMIHNSVTADKMSGKDLTPRDVNAPLSIERMALPAASEAASWYLSSGAAAPGAGFAAAVAARRIANKLGQTGDAKRNSIMADILSAGGDKAQLNMVKSRRAADEANRLFPTQPAVPFTYIPEENRAKPVPLNKD